MGESSSNCIGYAKRIWRGSGEGIPHPARHRMMAGHPLPSGEEISRSCDSTPLNPLPKGEGAAQPGWAASEGFPLLLKRVAARDGPAAESGLEPADALFGRTVRETFRNDITPRSHLQLVVSDHACRAQSVVSFEKL